MAKTYAQLTQQIEALKSRAEAIREREKAGVVSRIRHAIAIYGLTAQDLGFGAAAAAPTVGAPASVAPKYRDNAGNTWGGRGPRPAWLRAGLASGRSLESFAAGKGTERKVVATPQAGPAPTKGKKKFKSVVKYRDESGNQWSGRGPKPKWVKSALDAGKTLAQLAT